MKESLGISPHRWQPALAAVLAACLLPLSTAGADFSKYHTYNELTAMLQEAVKSHANIARLAEIGKTREGRSIWAVEIANPQGAPLDSRPALLVAANFEGDQVIGSELALFMVDYLLNSYGTNPETKQRIDSYVFYIIPRVNPDAAELMFAPVKIGKKTNASPYDDDNDGRIDEDGAEDLNGDGVITMMRAKDPHGDYMIHPDDARLMKKADPQRGEAGAYKIYWEGVDNDKDGFINEDGPGGVDLNRNFQHKYPYYSPDAGRFMVSEQESRALMDYMLKHRNVAMILTFGESDNLIVSPNQRGELGQASTIDLFAFAQQRIAEARGVGMVEIGGAGGRFPFAFGDIEMMQAGGRGQQQQPAGGRAQMPARRPAETVNADDLEYFRAVSEKYRSLTGLRSTPAVRVPGGAFFEWGYYQFGVPSFSTAGWGLPAPAREEGGAARMPPRPAEETRTPFSTVQARQAPAAARPTGGTEGTSGTAAFDLRMLRWMDSEKIDGFVNWMPFKHPTLGDLEIGGFRPYAAANPPAAKIAELGRTHSDFIIYLMSLFAKASIADTTVSSLGGGLFRITAEIANTGFLPTSTAQGVVSRSVKPTMVQLGVAPEAIVSGDAKTSFFQALAGSGNRQKYQWIVKGKAGETTTLKVVSQKGGSDSVTLTLK